MRVMVVAAVAILFLAACGSGDVGNTDADSGKGSPRDCAGADSAEESNEPELPPKDEYKGVLDAYFKALGELDADGVLATYTSYDREDWGKDMREELAELKKTVDRIEVTKQDAAWDEETGYWMVFYDLDLHMKDGEVDGEPNKEIYVVPEDGEWRISPAG